MLRGLVFVLAVLVILAGISLVVAPGWWLAHMSAMTASPSFRLWGLAGVIFGGILILAVAAREVGLRWLMGIIGVISFVYGLVMLIDPSYVRGMVDSFLSRPAHGQIMMALTGGIVRIVLGALVFYAAAKPPSVEHIAHTGRGLPHPV